MSHEPGTARASAELDRLLLEARSTAPRWRASVSRAGLIDAARASGRRVVGVTAPAGYGKSTLLAEWASRDDRAVAWVSLDRLDDEPLSLLVVLASALSRILPGHPDLAAEMVGPDVSVLGRAAPRLASALHESPDPFLLVLDDLHEVRSPACHDVLGVVVAGIPDGSQVVAASRAEQPHVPRLRASGDVVEIVTADLALGVPETERVFEASRVPVSHEVAATVTERTEGWPAGVYLASLVARHGDPRAVTITGADPYIADYLQRETFRRLSSTTRRFLRRTAVLDVLSAPLCDAVLGEQSSHRLLRRLEASSMFLVPLDRRRELFRYHALFREFLLAELVDAEPGLADALRVRAADWFEAHGSPERAVEQLLATPERDRCVGLVTRIVMGNFRAGRIATVERWLRTLGEDAVAAHPPLAVLAGYVAVYEGHALEAERWGAVADAASFAGPTVDGTASFASARAMFRALRCPGGPQQMVDDADLALAEEPGWSAWRDTALVLAGDALLLAGDTVGAVRRLEQAVEAASALGNADTLVLGAALLAQLDMDRDRWDEAAERVGIALGAIGRHRTDDYATSALGYAAGARLALHRGDVAAARRRLTQGMRARALCTYAFPTVAVRVRLHLARASWSTGDVAAVRHLLREVDDVLLHRPALGVLVDEAADLRKALGTGGHPLPPGSPGRPPLTPAELRLLPYLQTHLSIREIGGRLFVTRNTVSSQVGSIYRKLGVSSRGEAVARATAMGLLGS
ncbi:LuxR C-terminal-related transcriptional regulator [Krasilnikoviella flava]|uniref:LuxR family transcriptional regulator, maltose regulon positive regulatory protein n=1 Tax=Krasilnikoviella flava TaxID=526729 RepID=A0A1T5IDH0_9MICO|nr:LuxR C-terminal-related transcriptional regulator [Krasilnikoviella flava]SKC37199.1 LuxR family transcriptional regulator, maltose regulon positive regulatory protein [Krasilnikoviella flava]